MEFGAAYYPEHRDPNKWEYDLDHMKEANITALRVAEFAWSRLEPRDGEYDFSWLDTFADLAEARGIRLLVCPPLRTLPSWLMDQDSTLAIEREDGVILEYGSRYSFCINHPLLQEKGRAIALAMAKHYGPSKTVLGWHLDNEHGDEPDCHCLICRQKFQDWCQQRYGDIDVLNEKWGLAFWGLQLQCWEQIRTPRVSKTFYSPGHLQAWRQFRSDCTIEAMLVQAEVVRQEMGAHQYVTTNNQALWNNRTDYYDMARHLDVCGTNYYPPYGENARASFLGLAAVRGYKGANFQVHELRNGPHMIPGNDSPAPGEVRKLVWHCIANGADATYFFRWRACPFGCEQSHGTITDYDGRPTRFYAEAQQAGREVRELSSLLNGTQVKSEVAILYDFQSRWSSETGVTWNGPYDLYMERVKRTYNLLRAMGYSVDVVGNRSDCYGEYKAIVIPMMPVLDDETAGSLVRFVKQGGHLILHPLCGTKDEECRIHTDRVHPLLTEIIGADIREFVTVPGKTTVRFSLDDGTFEGSQLCDLATVKDDAVVRGSFKDCWYDARPSSWTHSCQQGSCTVLATFPDDAAMEKLFQSDLPKAGINPILKNVPSAVEIAARQSADTQMIFLLNHSGIEQTVELGKSMTDCLTNEIKTSVVLLPYDISILK